SPALYQRSPTPPPPPPPPPLCGYLQKQAGPLRAWKLRWFCVDPGQNRLLYFRSPQDVAPLGAVPLDAAGLCCPPDGGGATFHIRTPQRTYVLRALTQELMLFWLQQLQARRSSEPPHSGPDFLPALGGPLGAEAASWTASQSTLANMSIKHPLIQIQNSVHSLRKRSSPERTPPGPAAGATATASRTAPEPPALSLAEPPALPLAEPPALPLAEPASLQQEKLMLMEEVKAQKDAKMEAEGLRRGLDQRDAQLDLLREEVRRLTDSNQAKQQVIIKLSDQVTSCLSDQSSGTGPESQTVRRLQEQIHNLKDDIEAFRTQNQFLNSEIFQLTELWRRSSERERSLMEKCSLLEASSCQVESRYLGVLRELQESRSLDGAQTRALRRLIEEAVGGGPRGPARPCSDRDHDEYGFRIVPDYELEDMKLLAKIQALEIRSHTLLHQEDVERPLLARWAQYLSVRPEGALNASPELKALVRSGVPRQHRPRVWSGLVRRTTASLRGGGLYRELTQRSQASPPPASRQIQLDVRRTLTSNRLFCSSAQQQLQRLLLAFSLHRPAVGYCQGLNRLAGVALLVLQDEEEAFWLLVAVVEFLMPPDYYTHTLLGSR
ncbi:TBC1 domain family member 2A-like, partial [Menidia menidia]